MFARRLRCRPKPHLENGFLRLRIMGLVSIRDIPTGFSKCSSACTRWGRIPETELDWQLAGESWSITAEDCGLTHIRASALDFSLHYRAQRVVHCGVT